MPAKETVKTDDSNDNRIRYCNKAPEWAEHARFDADDEPCDDGRSGRICGDRKDEGPCPV